MEVKYYVRKMLGKKFEITGNVYELVNLEGNTACFQSVNDNSHIEMSIHRLVHGLLLTEDIRIIAANENLLKA